jgi:hypothetical protein
VVVAAGAYVIWGRGTPRVETSTIVKQDPSQALRDQALGFVKDFASTHRRFQADMPEFFDSLSGQADGLRDESSVAAFRTSIREKMDSQAPAVVDRWLDRFCDGLGGAWPSGASREAFKKAVFQKVNRDDVRDDASFDRLEAAAAAVNKGVGEAFKKMDFSLVADPAERKGAPAMMKAVREVLETTAAVPRKPHRLEWEIRVRGKRATSIPADGTPFEVFVRSDRPCQAMTLVEPGDGIGLVLPPPPRTSLSAGEWMKITSDNWEAASPKDRYLVYTASSVPGYPDSPMALSWIHLEKITPSPLGANRIRTALETGEAYPFPEKPAAPASKWWDMHSFLLKPIP